MANKHHCATSSDVHNLHRPNGMHTSIYLAIITIKCDARERHRVKCAVLWWPPLTTRFDNVWPVVRIIIMNLIRECGDCWHVVWCEFFLFLFLRIINACSKHRSNLFRIYTFNLKYATSGTRFFDFFHRAALQIYLRHLTKLTHDELHNLRSSRSQHIFVVVKQHKKTY